MKDVMAKLSTATSERVVLESTRVYLEKLIDNLIAEDLKDPDIRAWFFGKAHGDYRKAKRKFGFPRTKRQPRARRRSS
jgi:hypothetical protein